MKKVTECCILRKAKVRVLMFVCVGFVDEVRDVQMQLTKSLLRRLLTITAFLVGDFQLEQIYQHSD